MFSDTSRWLLSVVKNPQIQSVQGALQRGGDPNIVDETEPRNAFQEAIAQGNLVIVSSLLSESSQAVKVADPNLVGHSFESSIALAAKSPLPQRVLLMQRILEARQPFSEALFDTYLAICVQKIQQSSILKESDFACLAHYVSRLCATDIGELIRKDNNSDRYMVHLCQYSYAEKDGNELEGWHAIEFLPTRIFSLWEILVKLKKGIITAENEVAWSQAIRNEILIELETLKVEQERRAIAEANGLQASERQQLYGTLAGRFLTTIEANPNKEFCLASGYRGHAIYISFVLSNNTLTIRYDNLGRGLQKPNRDYRHPVGQMGQDRVVYPKTVEIQYSQNTQSRQKIMDFIDILFEIKEIPLPQKDDNLYLSKPQEIENAVFLEVVSTEGNGDVVCAVTYTRSKMPISGGSITLSPAGYQLLQQACDTANGLIQENDNTKHLIKDILETVKVNQREHLLSIIYDDNNTLQAALVQPNVNSGMPEQAADTCVATSHQVGLLSRFTDPKLYSWIAAEEKRCIFQDGRNQGALRGKDPIFWNETAISYTPPYFTDGCSLETISQILIAAHSSFYRLLQKELASQPNPPLHKEVIDNLNQFLNQAQQALSGIDKEQLKLAYNESISYEKDNISEFAIMSGLLLFKTALLEDLSIEKYQYLDKANVHLVAGLQIIPDTMTLMKIQILFCLGLCNHYLKKYPAAGRHYEQALSFTRNITQNENEPQALRNFRKTLQTCMGFLKLDQQDYNAAEEMLEDTAALEYNFQSDSYKRLFSTEALFGLGVVNFEKAKNKTLYPSLRLAAYISAEDYFTKSSSGKAQEWLNRLLKERQEIFSSLNPPAVAYTSNTAATASSAASMSSSSLAQQPRPSASTASQPHNPSDASLSFSASNLHNNASASINGLSLAHLGGLAGSPILHAQQLHNQRSAQAGSSNGKDETEKESLTGHKRKHSIL